VQPVPLINLHCQPRTRTFVQPHRIIPNGLHSTEPCVSAYSLKQGSGGLSCSPHTHPCGQYTGLSPHSVAK